MADKNIVEPCQKRSIEKKEKIIEAALGLFNEKGYYQTVTTDIAAAANVSVGIVYRYFKDKKDILLAILSSSFEDFQNTISDRLTLNADIQTFLDAYVDASKTAHILSPTLYKELMALAYLDDDIFSFFSEQDIFLRDKLIQCLQKYGNHMNVKDQKITLIQNLIRSYNHTVVYPKIDAGKRLDNSKSLLIDTLLFILEHD